MESRSLPKNIDYSDVLPQSVPAIARRRRYFPVNGGQFSFDANREIRIDIHSTNSMLDPSHSYLEFEVFNENAVNSFGPDVGGGNVFFDTLRVEQGGRVLSEIQQFHRFNAAILSPCQESHQAQITNSLTNFQRAMNGVGPGAGGITAIAANGLDADTYGNCKHNNDNALPPNVGYRFTIPILSGLFTQDKLLPLPLLRQDSPITIVLLMSESAVSGVWSAAPGAGDLKVKNISYNAQLIEVGRDVIDQIKVMRDEMMGGQLAISGQDYEHNQGLIPAGSTGEQIIRMPSRKRSIKSMFFVIQSSTYANGAAGMAEDNVYSLSFAGNANVNKYQLKVGSVVYPPQPVDTFTDQAGEELKRGEAIMELSKALGTLSFKNPSGRLNTITYCTDIGGIANGDTGDGAANTLAPGSGSTTTFCPFGLDTDAFQQTAIEAGIDTQTMSLESNLILEVANGLNSGLQPKNVHIYIIYDQHYYFNSNGMITFSN
jgi:hypothetical protein